MGEKDIPTNVAPKFHAAHLTLFILSSRSIMVQVTHALNNIIKEVHCDHTEKQVVLELSTS